MIEIAASAGLFILLWVILGNLLFKPYLALLEEREARTVGDERRASEGQREAQRLQGEVNEELRQAALQGIKIRDSHVAEAKQEAAEITEQAAGRAAEAVAEARAEIERQVAAAREQIGQDAEQVAGVMLERLLSGSATQVVH